MPIDPVFVSVQSSVLRDQVAAAIRTAIFMGALHPGKCLLEQHIMSAGRARDDPMRQVGISCTRPPDPGPMRTEAN